MRKGQKKPVEIARWESATEADISAVSLAAKLHQTVTARAVAGEGDDGDYIVLEAPVMTMCDNCDKKKATHRIRDNERYPDCDLCCDCVNCDGEACDTGEDDAPEEIVETVRGMSQDVKAEWLGGYPF